LIDNFSGIGNLWRYNKFSSSAPVPMWKMRANAFEKTRPSTAHCSNTYKRTQVSMCVERLSQMFLSKGCGQGKSISRFPNFY
jgi:hypothetical protein